MRLILSSDALPDAPLEVLLHAARRRALSGLELTIGADHAHGLDESICPLHQQNHVPCIPEDVDAVEWLRLPSRSSLIMTTIWSGAAHQMNAGLLLPEPILDPPSAIRLALMHGSDPARVREAADWARARGTGTCWDIRPGDVTTDGIDRVLDETMPLLSHVRLPGCGPEGEGSEGERSDDAVVGRLLSSLALRGYSGSVALVPSSPETLGAWSEWLLEKRGWGCGTAALKAATRAASIRATG